MYMSLTLSNHVCSLYYSGSIKFIDFEYSGMNSFAFDIGNFFNEFAGNNCTTISSSRDFVTVMNILGEGHVGVVVITSGLLIQVLMMLTSTDIRVKSFKSGGLEFILKNRPN